MKCRSILISGLAALIFAGAALSPLAVGLSSGGAGLGADIAQAQKKGGGGGGGGGKLSKSGDKGADLIAKIAGPVMIAIAGVVSVVAMVNRQIGLAVSAAAVTFLAGFYLFAPGSVEVAIKDFWGTLL